MDEISKIRILIKNSNKVEDMQFRLLLEDLVKQGGRPAENFLCEQALSYELDESIRANIIRCMGYMASGSYLITLKKILEGEDTLRLRKAAIISISKFNDNRALNLLNGALKRINNPILQDSIGTEISRIKKDNPILGLMPKFLNGVNDPKTFRTTLEILKQILNPADAQTFIYHLNSATPFVGDGAFEVLCWRGDESVKFSIFDFFKKKLQMIECIADVECYSLQDLLAKLERFITRNPDTINFILKELKNIYKETNDITVKDILINIFSSCPKREVLSFMEDIYNNEPGRREVVIQKLYGNEAGAYILIYKFKNDLQMKDKLLTGLLTTQAGSGFIIENYDSLEDNIKNIVLNNITETNYQFFMPLIESFLLSDDFSRKKFALDTIRKNQDLRYESILFDPDNEAVFLRMYQDYIETVSQLFFVQTFKLFINRMVAVDSGPILIKKYTQQTPFFIMNEPVITLGPYDDLNTFADKLLKLNNRDLNLNVLEIFYSIRTFDYKTYSKIQDFLEKYKELRGARISIEEKGLLNKVKANLMNVLLDLKAIDNGNTNINHFIEKSFPDYDLLEYVLKNHYLSFFVHRHKIFERIRRVFKLTNDIDAFDAVKFFLKRPELSVYFREEISQAAKSSNYLLKNDAEKIIEHTPQSLRIVLCFDNSNRSLYSAFENQLKEIVPEFEIVRTNNLKPTDIAIIDAKSIELLHAEGRLNTKKLYAILKEKEEFAAIRELGPKVFPPPISFYKVIKALIMEFFPAPGSSGSN